ncbi:MAG TPA: DUF1835 domain-containing protein [Gemmatimonadaceae bacterium]|nr:DUF1835 domain-containing protein [Gemmatimonadaceae bacterium]
MSDPTLHITNGDAAADGIRRATGEEVLAWRDVLHDGPVPAVDDAVLRRARAEFIASRGWGELGAVYRDFETRDATVRAAICSQPIVLWFEPDLYDQLQLLQVLDLLARTAGDCDAELTLVQPPTYLGGLTPDELAGLRRAGTTITEAHLALGRRAWDAFRAPSPERWQGFAAPDDHPLEFLAAAVRRHLEEYPAVASGLARSESQLLRRAAAGPIAMSQAFRDAQHMEEWTYLGDASFVEIVRELARAPHPLLRLTPALEGALHRLPVDRAAWEEPIAVTAEGSAVLAGDLDRVALCGIDRWLGGVHLLDHAPWRWTGERLTTGAA